MNSPWRNFSGFGSDNEACWSLWKETYYRFLQNYTKLKKKVLSQSKRHWRVKFIWCIIKWIHVVYITWQTNAHVLMFGLYLLLMVFCWSDAMLSCPQPPLCTAESSNEYGCLFSRESTHCSFRSRGRRQGKAAGSLNTTHWMKNGEKLFMKVNINALQGWIFCNLKHLCKIQYQIFSI